MVKLLKKFSLCLLISFSASHLFGQVCKDLEFKSSTTNRTINWEAFDGIDLPFTLVYGGPSLNRQMTTPLNFGFTHISDENAFLQIPAEKRAQLYYGTAYVNKNQPWELYRSPWDNDLSLYQYKWKNDYSSFSRGEGRINVDLMVFDIERQWRTDFDIIQLKSNENISSIYRNLSDEDFILTYKKDLREIYAKSLEAFNNNGGYASNTKVSSYSDAPIWNVFDNIQGASWQDWQNDPSLVNYITKDANDRVGGAFYDQLDFVTPSAYYYYDYPHPFAGEYLSYLLFQIESNRAWTNKPVIPFVWMRYSFTPSFQNQFIKPWMAEATAIFPFFSGADGLWLWENPQNFGNDENFATYEYFLKGLKRLSEYKNMFEGSYELVTETSARDYNELKTPIWRGIAKNGELLVAAHNPYATDENEETSILINYENFSRVIKLKGYEVFLCKFNLSVLGTKEEDLEVSIFPNPVVDQLSIEWPQNVKLQSAEVFNSLGQLIDRHAIKGTRSMQIPVQHIKEKAFYLHLKGGNFQKTYKIINSNYDH